MSDEEITALARAAIAAFGRAAGPIARGRAQRSFRAGEPEEAQIWTRIAKAVDDIPGDARAPAH